MCRNCLKKTLALLLAAFALYLPDAQGQNSKYKITVFLPDSISGRRISQGAKLFLLKQQWEKSSVPIDSAYITADKSPSFNGNFSSAGCYDIALMNKGTAGREKLMSFFYSSTSGEKFTEKFRICKRESPLLKETALPEKCGSENDIFLRLQNYSSLIEQLASSDKQKANAAEAEIKRIGTDSLSHVIPNLKFRCAKECEGSILEILLSYGIGKLPEDFDGTGPAPFADERMLYAEFGEKILYRYLSLLQYTPKENISNAIDKILNNRYLTLEELKGKIAWSVFSYFKDADVMGTESAAVYTAENYFLNGKIKLPDSLFFEAQYFTRLNAKTLLGMKAPSLELKNLSGAKRNVADMSGEYTIIYFYSTDCSVCKIETPKLVDFINSYAYTPLNVFAVYTGTDNSAWRNYAAQNFALTNPFVTWENVADIEMNSSFPMDYGITSTPSMFLLNREGKIIGRGIKSDNVKRILEDENNRMLLYDKLFKKIFDPLKPLDESKVKNVIDTLYSRATGNYVSEAVSGKLSETQRSFFTDMFRELFLDLGASNDYAEQQGAAYIGEKYIYGKEELWEEKSFVEQARRAVRTFKMNMLGTKASDAGLYDISGTPARIYDVKADFKVLFLYSPSCGICQEYAKELKNIYDKIIAAQRAKKTKLVVRFLGIYTGSNVQEWKSYVARSGFEWMNLCDKNPAEGIGRLYDIETVPSLYLLDKDNVIIAKDITPETLQKILKENKLTDYDNR